MEARGEVAGGGAGYYAHERPEVAQFVPREARRILDVGCGEGGLGRRLRGEAARQVFGIEVDPTAAHEAGLHLDGVQHLDLDRVDALPFPEASFDCVVCADVLEHLRDPERALTLLRRYLAPGGVLVASIPNVRHANALLPLLVEGRWCYQDAGILDRTHLRFFTLAEVAQLVQRTGYVLRHAEATVTPEHPAIPAVAELVGRLGGDPERFRRESTVVQVIVVASPEAAA